MDDSKSAPPRAWTPSGFDAPLDPYPGIGSSFTGPATPSVPVHTAVPVPAQTASAAAKGGLAGLANMANLSELKALVERMGGVEGILSTMGKVQKFVSTMQQFAPLVRLFLNKGSATTADKSAGSRPRRRSAGRKRRSAGSSSGSRSRAKRRTRR